MPELGATRALVLAENTQGRWERVPPTAESEISPMRDPRSLKSKSVHGTQVNAAHTGVQSLPERPAHTLLQPS